MTDFVRARQHQQVTRVRIGYLVAGVTIGALWMAHAGESPWQHAVRLVVLMIGVMTVAAVARRAAERRGQHPRHPRLGSFIALKGSVITLAVMAGFVLDGRIANPDMWIGLGLIAVVALIGPLIHPWLFAEAV